MAYEVRLTRRARRDLDNLDRDIDARGSGSALIWYRGLRKAILTLEPYPNRCPVTPESSSFRHLLHGRKPHVYRVIYRVMEDHRVVEVLHVRHGAMERFKSKAL
jgi:plasmid stabilization system protein ParE